MQDWELVPSSSFSDWKLEKNPVSGFLTLIKNLITSHSGNQVEFGVGRSKKNSDLPKKKRGGGPEGPDWSPKKEKWRIFVFF
jgi:hypothetical protein